MHISTLRIPDGIIHSRTERFVLSGIVSFHEGGTAGLQGTEFLVCKQIIREHDEFAGRRGCRINACPSSEEDIPYGLPYRLL